MCKGFKRVSGSILLNHLDSQNPQIFVAVFFLRVRKNYLAARSEFCSHIFQSKNNWGKKNSLLSKVYVWQLFSPYKEMNDAELFTASSISDTKILFGSYITIF